MLYDEGDLIFAFKKDNYESSQYEWCGGIDYPLEYAIVTLDTLEFLNKHDSK